ncbi:tyrosine-type recombinase/integrase [Curtobacterium sp. S6]|uniref:tyrosine-type recombinase/integrase n=1 Tax=Curtobacterium sp. S6 TaxID=1479623 RepID=UPI0004AB8DF1|nr:site-specific integrase [Curtobacterium sp. S6]
MEVTARGASKAKATNRLKARIEQVRSLRRSTITADSTVAELIERYAEQETGWTDSTRRLYRDGLERNIRPRIGDVRLRELSTGMLDELIAGISDRRPYTIRIDGRRVTKRVGGIGAAKQCRLLLRLALDQAVRWDAVPTNPARSVRAVKDEKKPIEVLDQAELSELRLAVRNHYQNHPLAGQAAETVPDVLDLLIATGARIGEILCLKWTDLNLDTATLTIAATLAGQGATIFRQEHTKTSDSARVLLLPVETVRMLRRRQEASTTECIFPGNRGTQLQRASFTKMFHTAAGERFSHVTEHTLRRSVATLIKEASNAEAAALQLGHSSTTITYKHYITRKSVSDARAVLDNVLSAEPEDSPETPHIRSA